MCGRFTLTLPPSGGKREKRQVRLLSEEMGDDTLDLGKRASAFRRMVEIVELSGVPFILHAHAATRTVEDAAQNLSFDVARIVKTVAFHTSNGGLVLAALRGTRRVDYPRLAALVGCQPPRPCLPFAGGGAGTSGGRAGERLAAPALGGHRRSHR